MYYSTMFLVMLAICSIGFASSPAKKSSESDDDDDDLSSLPSEFNEKEDAEDLLQKLKKSFEIEFSIDLVKNLIELPKYNSDDKNNELYFTTILMDVLFDNIEKKVLALSGPEGGYLISDVRIEAISRWKISKETLSKISDLIEKYKLKKNNKTMKPQILLKNLKDVIKNELEKAGKSVKEGNISEFIKEDDIFDGEDDFFEQEPPLLAPVGPASIH